MKIETKFNIKDAVFYSENNSVFTTFVLGIETFVGEKKHQCGAFFKAKNNVFYHLNNGRTKVESELYSSAEEVKLVKNENDIIKFYNKADAPPEATFLCEKIERNGILDLSVPSYEIPKANEKIVYLFVIPKK